MVYPSIVALWGRANSGKTTTINITVDKLLQNGASVIKGATARSHDKDTVVKLKWKDKIIGVVTEGDSADAQNRGYLYLGKDCDIYVFAARSRGNSVRNLENKFKNSFIVWHRSWAIDFDEKNNPSLKSLFPSVNEKQACGLFDTIVLL